jgi:hypothetical protein
MSHFPKDEPQFPRKASTLVTENRQFDVYSKEHVLELFQASKGFDCRISAYPNYDYLATKKGVLPPRYVPQNLLLFIDQEQGDIKTTLHNIKMLLSGGHPTVIWTGHGYHIYLPIFLLDKQFKNNEEVTVDFLRFIERHISHNQSDKGHYPSLRNSMMRIPFSWNSKAVAEDSDNFEVRIIQKWDGFRVSPSVELLAEFNLMKQRAKLKELKQERILKEQIKSHKIIPTDTPTDPLKEFLIFESQGIADGRKNILYYVIARYLIRERCLEPEIAKAICHDWLERCNKVRKLEDASHLLKYHVNHCIKDAINRNRDSMPIEILKDYSVEAYNQLIAEYEDFKSRNISPQIAQEVKSGAS